jgi:hypothetical protein
MTETTKKKFDKMTSPKGKALWPKLTKPDTTYVKDGGVYCLKLRLKRGDPGVDEFLAELESKRESAVAGFEAELREQKKLAKGKAIKVSEPSIKPVIDEENGGEETGEVDINFKMKAVITSKEGEVYKKRPALFDAKGVEIEGNKLRALRVGTGSAVRVSFECVPFYKPAVGAGLSLRLKAVQIVNLVEYQGGDAKSHGFGAEDGFSAADVEDFEGDSESEPAAKGAPKSADGEEPEL